MVRSTSMKKQYGREKEALQRQCEEAGIKGWKKMIASEMKEKLEEAKKKVSTAMKRMSIGMQEGARAYQEILAEVKEKHPKKKHAQALKLASEEYASRKAASSSESKPRNRSMTPTAMKKTTAMKTEPTVVERKKSKSKDHDTDLALMKTPKQSRKSLESLLEDSPAASDKSSAGDVTPKKRFSLDELKEQVESSPAAVKYCLATAFVVLVFAVWFYTVFGTDYEAALLHLQVYTKPAVEAFHQGVDTLWDMIDNNVGVAAPAKEVVQETVKQAQKAATGTAQKAAQIATEVQ